MSRESSGCCGGGGGVGLGGNPPAQAACASCKHQRKRCDSACELSRYFPASKYQEFQNAHKLFGVSNIQKLLNAVEPEKRSAAAETLLIEGTIRREDPVYGSFGIICKLESEVEVREQELRAVNHQLAYFREREQLIKRKEHLESALQAESSLPLNEVGRHYQSTSEMGEDPKIYDFSCQSKGLSGDHGKSYLEIKKETC